MEEVVRRVREGWGGDRGYGLTRIEDPADGTPFIEAPNATPEEVEAAVEAARTAQPGWTRTPAAQRGAAVARAASAVERQADALAWLTTREMGKPLRDARAGVQAGIDTLRQYAELGPLHRGRSLAGTPGAADLMVYEPRGVVAVITPWNDPVAVSCGLLGAALVTGNTAVYKPSERTPATGWLLGELLAGELPEGVLTTLTGDGHVGVELTAQRLDVVAHVGSSTAGQAVAAACACTGAKALLENGGCDPLIVDAGVDPAWAAAQAAIGSFANAGQICVSVERIYVHQALAERFLAELVSQAQGLKTGSGLDDGTQLGPLVDRRHREHVHGHVDDAGRSGADVLCGGNIPEGPGAFYPATVLCGCTDEMPAMCEETFGPVAPVAVVGSFEEALGRAAESAYGLAATVLTPDLAHATQAWHELPVGTVKVNSVFGGAPGGSAHPRRASGQGYGYGPELLDELTYTKVVHLAAAQPG